MNQISNAIVLLKYLIIKLEKIAAHVYKITNVLLVVLARFRLWLLHALAEILIQLLRQKINTIVSKTKKSYHVLIRGHDAVILHGTNACLILLLRFMYINTSFLTILY